MGIAHPFLQRQHDLSEPKVRNCNRERLGIPIAKHPSERMVLGSEIAARSCNSLSTFHRTTAMSCLRIHAIAGLGREQWESQSQITSPAGIAIANHTNHATSVHSEHDALMVCHHRMPSLKHGVIWKRSAHLSNT